jgi:hypothetical protein
LATEADKVRSQKFCDNAIVRPRVLFARAHERVADDERMLLPRMVTIGIGDAPEEVDLVHKFLVEVDGGVFRRDLQSDVL